MFPCCAHYGDGGISGREKEITSQSQGFCGVGINDTPMREYHDALADVPTRDVIKRLDDALAEGL